VLLQKNLLALRARKLLALKKVVMAKLVALTNQAKQNLAALKTAVKKKKRKKRRNNLLLFDIKSLGSAEAFFLTLNKKGHLV
jgi:hypothetical protein